MPDLALLLPVQKVLLAEMVEAAERLAPEQRTHFRAFRYVGRDKELTALSHPGLAQSRSYVFFGDLKVFAHFGLVLLSHMGKNGYEIVLLPQAYLYYGTIKQPTLPEVRVAVRDVIAATLQRARRELYVLERAAATYGSESVPAQVAIELEQKRLEAAELKQRLSNIGTD